jgi:hypothetical protein
MLVKSWDMDIGAKNIYSCAEHVNDCICGLGGRMK